MIDPSLAPQLSWLFAALCVQRERQRWHRGVVDSLADDEDGDVPGYPGWTFYRHGIGVCMTGPDGECLDVDYEDPDAAVIDVWFFATRVESVRGSAAWIAENRLWHWRPSCGVIVDGIDELVARGLVAYGDYRNKAIVSPAVDTRAIAAWLAADPDRARATLEPGGEDAHRAAHRAWILDRLATSAKPGEYLELAIDGAVTADDKLAICRPFLARCDWAAGHVIELLRARPALPILPEVATLLRAASLVDDPPFPPFHACAYLIERQSDLDLALDRFDAWSRLEVAHGFGGNPFLSNYASLALRHLPDRARALIRASLRSSTPACVHDMAALLAAIDLPWCHRELIAAMSEPRRDTHAYIAAALRCTSSELARRRADATVIPTTHDPQAVGYTFAEVVDANADDWVRHSVDAVRGVADEIRARYLTGEISAYLE